jgi:hypothetical protein
MRGRLLAVVVFVNALMCFSARGQEQLLTFDEFRPASGATTLVSNGYGGLRWTNMAVRASASGGNVVFSSNANSPGLIYSGHPFDLNSAWWPGGSAPAQLTLVALYGPTPIFTNVYFFTATNATRVRLDIQNVTGVRINSTYPLDDLSVSFPEQQVLSLPGWFEEGGIYFPVSDAITIAAGDLNGDGLGDLVMGGRSGTSVGVGLHDGTLRIVNGAVSGNFIAIGDLTQDGRDDAMMVGVGTGFASGARLIVFTNYFSFPTNGVTNVSSGTGIAAIGDFGSTNRVLRLPGSSDVAVADFNGDGKLDYVALNDSQDGGLFSSAFFSASTNLGNGTFRDPWQEGASSDGHSSVVARDFDLDGDADFATANERTGMVAIFQNDGKARFPTARRQDSGLARPVAVAAGDLNGDGIEDLAVRSAFSGLSVLTGLGGGRFSAPLVITHGGVLPSTNRAARTLVVQDLNSDGAPDIAFVSGTEVATLLNVFPPRLHVANIEDLIEVYWATNFAKGAILESSAILGPNAVWTPVTFPPIDTVGSRIVFDSGEESRLFFRLRRPE